MKVSAQGAQLLVEDPVTPATYIAVVNLTNVPAPSPEKSEIDVTDLDSTAEETIPGIIRLGDLSFSWNAAKDDPGQELVRGDPLDPAAPTRKFRVSLPKLGIKFDFEAFVKKFEITGETNAQYKVSGSLRMTTIPVEAALP